MSGWYLAETAAIPPIVPKITHLAHEILSGFSECRFNEPESTLYVPRSCVVGVSLKVKVSAKSRKAKEAKLGDARRCSQCHSGGRAVGAYHASDGIYPKLEAEANPR